MRSAFPFNERFDQPVQKTDVATWLQQVEEILGRKITSQFTTCLIFWTLHPNPQELFLILEFKNSDTNMRKYQY